MWATTRCSPTATSRCPTSRPSTAPTPWSSRASPELKAGPLAHLPSGSFWATAAWLSLSAITINIGRALGTLAGHGLDCATVATLQRTLLAVPARLARSARRYHLHLPAGWRWQRARTWLKRRIDGLPLRDLTATSTPTTHSPRTLSTPPRFRTPDLAHPGQQHRVGKIESRAVLPG